MSQASLRSFAFGHQLIARTQSRVVQRITVILLVTQEVSAPFRSREQAGGRVRLTDVHGRNFPTQRDWGRTVNRMELIPFGLAAARSTPSTVRVFTVASHDQRFSVHHIDASVLTALDQTFFHKVKQPLCFRRSQSAAHRRLRRQSFPWPQALGPIGKAARPGCRPFMQNRPEVNHNDLEVKDSCRVSRAPNCQNPHRTAIMYARVRVPCLVSLKKGSTRQACTRTRYFSSLPSTDAS